MKNILQDRILDELEQQISGLKTILGENIAKHSDAAYDLKDLKICLEELRDNQFDPFIENMLVMGIRSEDNL